MKENVSITAGGLVLRYSDMDIYAAILKRYSSEGEVQYILPKGYRDTGETLEETARREIAEESGLTDLLLKSYLGFKNRYNQKGNLVKITHFYLFETKQIEATPLEKDKELIWFEIRNIPRLIWDEQQELVEEYKESLK